MKNTKTDDRKEKVFEYFSSVTEKPVDWLWYPYIPCGKITLLQGDPGDGKSTFMLNIVALLTKGHPLPDGYEVLQSAAVVYQCAEDDIADTVKPRLLAAGADCDKVAYIIDESCELTLEDNRIEKTIRETGARLLILDPIQSFLVQDGGMQNAGRMRTVLGKLSVIAARYNCAIVLIGHMNKTSSGKNLYRSLGSIDIAAISRSVLMIARDSTNSEIRYMFPVKSSLAPEGCAIGFAFDRDTGFQWIGPCEIDLKAPDEDICYEDNKRAQAASFLSEVLSNGDMQSTAVISLLQKKGMSQRTIYTAKKDMGVRSYKKDTLWYWQLPESDDDEDAGRYSKGR